MAKLIIIAALTALTWIFVRGGRKCISFQATSDNDGLGPYWFSFVRHEGGWIALVPQRTGLIAIAIMAVLVLAGCSTTGSRDRALIAAGQAATTLPAMSDSELTCAAEPRAPSPKSGAARVRESQVTDYILDLREAGADCRDKLGVTRRVWRKVEEVKSRATPPATKGESK